MAIMGIVVDVTTGTFSIQNEKLNRHWGTWGNRIYSANIPDQLGTTYSIIKYEMYNVVIALKIEHEIGEIRLYAFIVTIRVR